jgi:Astacin (Peptidase family M12A)
VKINLLLYCIVLFSSAVQAQAVFSHVTTGTNTAGHITTLDHPRLNGNPQAVVFVSPVWEAQGDQNPTNTFGVWYNGTRWTIFNQNRTEMSAIPTNRFRFKVLAFSAPTASTFVHTVTAANKAGHITTLDHPSLNNNPNAVITVTQLYGVYNTHEIGVWYNNGRWTIFNQDRVELPLNATFNVLIGTGGISGATTIQHTHTDASKLGEPHKGYTILDYPAINNKSDWSLFVTQRWIGTYNALGFNIWYDDPSPSDPYHFRDGKWFIYNSGNELMPNNAAFNILAVPTGTNVVCTEPLNSTYESLNRASIASAQSCLTTDRINGSNNESNRLRTGTIIFYRTNEGRLGKMEILEYGYNIRLRCTTYNDNGTVYRQNENLTIRGTWSCDLDNAVESSTGSDFFWEQNTAVERYLSPRNNAAFWVAKTGAGTSACTTCKGQQYAPKTSKRDTAKISVAGLFGPWSEQITVEIINDRVVFQGDMILGRASDFFRRSGNEWIPKAQERDAGTPDLSKRWPGGVIPFTIAAGHPGRTAINAAIATLNRSTPLCLRARTTETDFIMFTNDNSEENGGCWSWVGRQGGRQDVNIGSGCEWEGIVLHEILHAAGVFHEQSRSDRDGFVRINWENIDPPQRHNFNRQTRTYSSCRYDHGSIMHYGRDFFSRNGRPTIEPTTPPTATLGGDILTACDIQGLRFLYPDALGCAPVPPATPAILFFDQPNFTGTSRRYAVSSTITTIRDFPSSLVGRPISIDVPTGFVAILTSDCTAEFPSVVTLVRDEANIVLNSPLCTIEFVRIAEERVVNIRDFGRRCPNRHVRGDQEFGGNVHIYCGASLSINVDLLSLSVFFAAEEIGGDSYVDQRWTESVFTAPAGRRIIAVDRYSSETIATAGSPRPTWFRSRSAGPEFGICNEGEVHVSGRDFQIRGTLVRDMEIVGDTGHQDINTGNCGCDTGVRNIRFHPVRVYMATR